MFARLLTAALICSAIATNAGAADPDDPKGNDLNLYSGSAQLRGRRVFVRVRHPDADLARKAIAAALNEARRVYVKLDSAVRNGEIGGINQVGGREEVIVSEETFTVLENALKFCRITGGAYDPTVKSFDYLWKFDRKPFVAPLPDELAARARLAGCDKLVLKPNRAVRLANEEVRVSVNELLAGHALERMSGVLERAGISRFKLAVGRDQYVRGTNGTRYWYSRIGHPAAIDRTMLQVYVGSHAIATRSITEHRIVHRGTTYHDVIDVHTGRPASGVLQATVIATDSILADALSYALLVMKPEQGLALVAGLKESAEAILVTADGRVLATDGVKSLAPKLPARVPTAF